LRCGGHRRADVATPWLVMSGLLVARLDAAGLDAVEAVGRAACVMVAVGLLLAPARWPPPLPPGEENTATETPATTTHRHTAAVMSITRCKPAPAERGPPLPHGNQSVRVGRSLLPLGRSDGSDRPSATCLPPILGGRVTAPPGLPRRVTACLFPRYPGAVSSERAQQHLRRCQARHFRVGQPSRGTRPPLDRGNHVIVDQDVQCRQEGCQACLSRTIIDASSHFVINPTHRVGLSWGITDPGSRAVQAAYQASGMKALLDVRYNDDGWSA
jgi:hypothetical protein